MVEADQVIPLVRFRRGDGLFNYLPIWITMRKKPPGSLQA